MDIRVVERSKIPPRVLLSLYCCVVPLLPIPVLAQGFLCDATQAASDQLPVLDKACPLGQGLWGNSLPKGKDSNFWIQCGFLTVPLSVEQAKVLYEKISTDVWMKPEGTGTRCLIGPYKEYEQVRQDLARVRSLAGYKEAFIREVAKNAVAQPQPATTQVQSKPNPNPRQPAKVEKNKPVTTSLPNIPPAKPNSAATTVIRHQTSLNGLTYAIPYTSSDNVQFYMEHNQAWNRLSYSGAQAMCKSYKMRLVSEEEWQQLLRSKVMEKEQWPMYLPYWGANNKGLFTSGKITSLKGNSLLNVLCVK